MIPLYFDQIVDGVPWPFGQAHVEEHTGVRYWSWAGTYDHALASAAKRGLFDIRTFDDTANDGFYVMFCGSGIIFDSLYWLITLPEAVAEKLRTTNLKLLMMIPWEPILEMDQFVKTVFPRLYSMAMYRGLGEVMHRKLVMLCTSRPNVALLPHHYVQHDFFQYWLLSDGKGYHSSFDWQVPKEKTFICLNNRAHTHRACFYQEMRRLGHADKGFYSFINDCPVTGYWKDVPCEVSKQFMIDNPITPLYLDRSGVEGHNFNMPPQLHRAYVNVVVETFYEWDHFFITEKTYKPISYGQPFIVVGPQGTLAHLRDLGYRTFGDFWDEGYDEMPNDFFKLRAIADLVGGLDLATLDARKDEMRAICEHNQNLLFSRDLDQELHDRLAGI